jgi:hypothetical protein
LASFNDSSATQKAALKILVCNGSSCMDSVELWLIEGSAKRKSTNRLSEIVDHLGRYPKEFKVDVVGTRFLSQGENLLKIEMSLPLVFSLISLVYERLAES